jgi:hypothetical protein
MGAMLAGVDCRCCVGSCGPDVYLIIAVLVQQSSPSFSWLSLVVFACAEVCSEGNAFCIHLMRLSYLKFHFLVEPRPGENAYPGHVDSNKIATPGIILKASKNKTTIDLWHGWVIEACVSAIKTRCFKAKGTENAAQRRWCGIMCLHDVLRRVWSTRQPHRERQVVRQLVV